MAKRKSKTESTSSKAKPDEAVVRIKASDSKPKKTKSSTKVSRATKSAKTAEKPTKKSTIKSAIKPKKKLRLGWLGAFFGYFKNSWAEIKQVHWPTRKATWGLTFAVLVFAGFYVIFVMILDAGFKTLFEALLK